MRHLESHKLPRPWFSIRYMTEKQGSCGCYRLWNQVAWIHILAPFLTSFVTLDKPPNSCLFQFSQLQNREFLKLERNWDSLINYSNARSICSGSIKQTLSFCGPSSSSFHETLWRQQSASHQFLKRFLSIKISRKCIRSEATRRGLHPFAEAPHFTSLTITLSSLFVYICLPS